MNTRLKLFAATLSGVIIILTIVIFITINRTDELLSVYQEKDNIQIAYEHVQAAERAQRAYVLTGDQVNLQIFNRYYEDLGTVNNAQMLKLITYKFKEMKATTNLMESGDREAAIKAIQINDRAQYLDLIEKQRTLILQDLKSKELSLSYKTSLWKNTILLTSCFASVFSAGILLFNYYQLKKNTQ